MTPISALRDLAVKATGLPLCHRTMRMHCLSYQIGDLAKATYKLEACDHLRRNSGRWQAYRAEAMIAVADSVTQLRLLAYELGYDWDEMIALGEERFMETMAQITRGERE